MTAGGCADFTRPGAARVYNLLIGEADYEDADKALADVLADPVTGHPGIARLARQNRCFILAAAAEAASAGIGQFIDLGCGLPASPMVHQVAQGGRVLYVDIDPMVTSHVGAVLDRPGLAVLKADAADPASVLGHPLLAPAAGIIHPDEPVCLLLGGTLSAMDAETARNAVAAYAEAAAPGSRVAISCVSFADRALGERMAEAFTPAGHWRNHGCEDIRGFFGVPGLRMDLGPVRDAGHWPAGVTETGKPAMLLAGVAVKG